MPDNNILLTGASGFLGKYIHQALIKQGFVVHTLGRSGATIVCDLANQVPVLSTNYYAVVHAAGKAHMVPKTEEEKELFFKVNFEGSKNLLKALENCGSLPKTIVFISSVSVYGLSEGENIDENSPLNAPDPYGQSKIKAEDFVKQWSTQNTIAYFNLRLPLISGANPPGNLGSMVKALKKGYYFRIGNGSARKSIVLAEDVGNFIPSLFTQNNSGSYNLTDGEHPTFAQIEDKIAASIGRSIKIKIPAFIARLLSMVGSFIPKFPLNNRQYKKITSPLTFSDEKARKNLGWKPTRFLEAPIQ